MCVFRAHSAKVEAAAAVAMWHCALVCAHNTSNNNGNNNISISSGEKKFAMCKRVCEMEDRACKRDGKSKLQPSTLVNSLLFLLSIFQGMDKSTVHCAPLTWKATLFGLNCAQFPATEMFNPLIATYTFFYLCLSVARSKTMLKRSWVCRWNAEKNSHPKCLVVPWIYQPKKKYDTKFSLMWHRNQINQSKMASVIAIASSTAATKTTTKIPDINDECSQFQFECIIWW